MAEFGAKMIVWDNDLAPLAAAKDFAPAATAIVDVANYSSVEAAFQAAVREFGQAHIVVNDAGINGPIYPTWEYPIETWDKVMAVNLTGVFYVSRIAVEHMRSKKYGRITQIASIAVKEGVVNLGAYSAAKGGVIALAKSMTKGQLHRTGHDGNSVIRPNDRRAHS
jgi:2-dehydro-3-deoxy-L-rhamnonate dehydrogenase (NAD+)